MILHSAAFAFVLLLFSGGEWDKVREIAPGSERGEAIANLLADDSVDLESAELTLSWEAGQRAADSLEFELAFRIQEQLYRRVPAEWSGVNMALTAHKLGRWQTADLVLGELLESKPTDAAGLWSQRGIFALGDGRQRLAREYFGRAICLGSPDATGILAREDLALYNFEPARAGFRAALASNSKHPWALRGWGLSLLGAAALHPGTRN